MTIYNNHKQLFGLALVLFLVLTLWVAILPALNNQARNAPLPATTNLTPLEAEGKAVFIAEGCVACHTQQVRNIEMDKVWGPRPGIAADYARSTRPDIWRNAATLMGSERTGPDLTNIGNRQPAEDWHYLHLFNPRSVVAGSVMPSYPWLFEVKVFKHPDDKVVNVPEGFREDINGTVIASHKALALVAYLQSLKQVPLPDGRPVPRFLCGTPSEPAGATQTTGNIDGNKQADGTVLYATHCQSCHQANGEGLPGAFPSLKGSKIVLDDDPTIQVSVIMNGYNGRVSEGYGIMPPVGVNNGLKPAEVAAIINHERRSWGNTAKLVTAAQVQKIIEQSK